AMPTRNAQDCTASDSDADTTWEDEAETPPASPRISRPPGSVKGKQTLQVGNFHKATRDLDYGDKVTEQGAKKGKFQQQVNFPRIEYLVISTNLLEYNSWDKGIRED